MKPSEDPAFQKIEGWLSDDEADALYEAALRVPEFGCIVEIGSYKGRSTYALASGCEHRLVRIFAVDPFTGNPGEEAYFREPFKSTFLRNLDRFIHAGNVVPLIMSSAGASEWMTNRNPNLVFIDGNHIYWDAVFDMRHWWSRIRPDGYMAIHDTNGTHPAVVEALKHFLSDDNRHVEYLTGTISWIRKANHE